MTTILAYLIIGFFMLVESRLRQSRAAKNMERGTADQDSAKFIGRAFAVMFLLLAPGLNYFGIGRLDSSPQAWSGIMLMLAGLGLRVWASRTLGAFYSPTVLIRPNSA